MLIKVSDLSLEKLSSLTQFLASESNELPPPPTRRTARFASLVSAKEGNNGGMDVVIRLAETMMLADKFSQEQEHNVPTSYLLELVQAMGLFSKNQGEPR